MPNLDNPETWTHEYAWSLIDQRLLNLKLHELILQMREKLTEIKETIWVEGVKRGNPLYARIERLKQEEEVAEEFAQKKLDAAIETWEAQGYKPCHGIYRAVQVHVIFPLFEQRRDNVSRELLKGFHPLPEREHITACLRQFSIKLGRRQSRWRKRIEVLGKEANYALVRERKAEADAEARRQAAEWLAANVPESQPAIEDDPQNWSELRRDFEHFRVIKRTITGPRETIPESLIRRTLARKYGVIPEEVTPEQVRFEMSGLLQAYPALTIVPSATGADTSQADAQEESPRKKRPRQGLTEAQEFRRSVIFGVLELRLEGLEYCEALDKRTLDLPATWKADGCPNTYVGAYWESSRHWRQKIQDEKTRYREKYDATPPDELERIIAWRPRTSQH